MGTYHPSSNCASFLLSRVPKLRDSPYTTRSHLSSVWVRIRNTLSEHYSRSKLTPTSSRPSKNPGAPAFS